MKKYLIPMSIVHGGCDDCGLSYKDPAFVETSVPDDVWEIISPSYDHGCGLLCVGCIAKRCAEAGLRDVPVRLITGSICEPEPSEELDRQRQRGATYRHRAKQLAHKLHVMRIERSEG